MRSQKKASVAVQQNARRSLQVQKSVVAIVAVISVMLIFWLSAVPAINWYELAHEAEELRDAKATWSRNNIHDYEFEYHVTCLCDAAVATPVMITVRDAAFDRTYLYDTGERVDRSGEPATPRTMADTFATVAGLLELRPASLEVSYDPVFGFPTDVRVDFDKGVDGDEVGYYVARFRILADGGRGQ